MLKKESNRRSFIKFSTKALVSLPIIGSLNYVALASDDRLSEDDPTAKALGYKENTTEVDAATYPTHSADQICSACILYQGSDPEWGGCSAFPGKQVAGKGWCAAYAPKPT